MYYKVVKSSAGKLYSSFAEGDLTVEYIPGVWVSSPVGPLMVYDSYAKAMEAHTWLDQPYADDGAEVWRVEIKNVSPPHDLLVLGTLISKDQKGAAMRFWTEGKNGDVPVMPAPDHTVLAGKVKLIIRVAY